MDGVDIIEKLLFCKSILSGTKAKDLFDITTNFMDHNNIKWENYLGVCTDGARAMSGQYGGFSGFNSTKSSRNDMDLLSYL
jgi:hypothetical protein